MSRVMDFSVLCVLSVFLGMMIYIPAFLIPDDLGPMIRLFFVFPAFMFACFIAFVVGDIRHDRRLGREGRRW